MDIQIKSKTELENTYLIKDISPAYANALRRFSMDFVPTLAIEDVEIKMNSSALYDEVLAHRIGLIPLTTDLKSYVLPEGEEITAMNSVVLTLSKEGPSTVLSSDFKTKDPKVKPAFDEIQVVKLIEDQSIELTATAVMGQGRVHAKWSPCNTYYSYEPEIKVNNKSSKLKDFIDKFPPQVVHDGKIDEKAITNSMLIDACDGVCDDIVSIKYNNNNFLFTIESFGQLTPEEIFGETLVQFNKELDTLKELVKEIKN